MQNILLTGGRAPSVLELARILNKQNYKIYLAESISYPLSKYSNTIYTNFKIHSPQQSELKFINDLLNIIKKENINLLIPNCEEIFYISKYISEFKDCIVLCKDLNTLDILHNKWKFFELLQSFSESIFPDTQLITNKKQIESINFSNFVFKPIYSRFADQTLIKPKKEELYKIKINNWIIQEYIQGIEYSSYSFAFNGKLIAHTAYYSKYRAGHGAGIYFEYCDKNNIQSFVEKIIQMLNFTGHISFDFIEDENGQIKVLECNPRITSGIHFFSDNLINNNFQNYKNNINKKNNMLILPIFIYHFNKILQISFWKDLFKAKDIIFSKQDFLPFLGQFLSFGELLYLSFKYKISLSKATTHDIEWNG